jgi:3-hydroxybutyryl-CoA dehydratase
MNVGFNYYEDVVVGDHFTTDAIVVTESQTHAFAGLSGDFFDLHVEDEFAKGLGGRAAHGILGLALTDGLKNRSEYRFRAVAALGWTWKFVGPIHVGDRIQAEISVQAKRPDHFADRGVLTLAFEVKNQRGELVQEGTHDLIVLRRGRDDPTRVDGQPRK